MLKFAILVLLSAATQAAAPPLATPRGNPALWISDQDYPPSALAAGAQGTTGFRLDVSAAGAATACTVLVSSGSADLDATTCTLLKRRSRFFPAHDAQGVAVAGQWSSHYTWSLPKN